jgi:glyceraldehyde 3-phosphate dehydrogenase
MKIGINGFGRIGRLAFRAASLRNDIEVVGINDLVEPDYMAYMLRYDSTHGQFEGTIEVKDGNLVVNGKTIRVTAEKDPANLKWDEVGAEVVIESTNRVYRSVFNSGHSGKTYPGRC